MKPLPSRANLTIWDTQDSRKAFRAMFGLNFLPYRRDFVSMGRGIAARHERCRSWWSPHLQQTRLFVQASTRSANSVAVLGAGRLLDLNLDHLAEHCREIHLFDADRGCTSFWVPFRRRYGKRIVFRVEEVTGVLDEWTRTVQGVKKGEPLDHALEGLEASDPAWSCERFDAVVSLNLLGQIPLYWRDRVTETRYELTYEEHQALTTSMSRLQAKHIQAVKAATRWSVVVSDREYLHYIGGGAEWEALPALFGGAEQAFEHAYSLIDPQVSRETWWWHVAPQYVESDDCGSIHVVEARALHRAPC